MKKKFKKLLICNRLNYKKKLLKRFITSLKAENRYYIKRVIDKGELGEIYHLRYRIYCLEKKFLSSAACKNSLESDTFDGHAIHIAAYNKKNEIVGYVRLIMSQETTKFPTEKEFNLSKLIIKIGPKNIAEVSRLIVLPEYRQTMLFFDLMRAITQLAENNNIHYIVGTIEQWLYKQLRMLIGDFPISQKAKFTYNTHNYGFILQLSIAKKKIKQRSLLMSIFFNRKIKIINDN